MSITYLTVFWFTLVGHVGPDGQSANCPTDENQERLLVIVNTYASDVISKTMYSSPFLRDSYQACRDLPPYCSSDVNRAQTVSRTVRRLSVVDLNLVLVKAHAGAFSQQTRDSVLS